jgi:hypothetical protein
VRERQAGPLLTAADSQAFLLRAPRKTLGASASSSPGIPVKQGDVVTVSVASMDNGRCETVTVSGAASATLWTGIGTPTACQGSTTAVTLPPIAAAGDLVFDLPLIANSARVTGTSSPYTVAFEDGGDADYNDIVLRVDIVTGGTPSLICTASVQRGQEVVCKASGDGVAVTNWEFKVGSWIVTSSSTSNEWRGPAVYGGTVTAQMTVNGAPAPALASTFVVSARPSKWLQNIAYRRGPELTAPDADPGPGVLLGQNCPEINGAATCVPTRRVQPDPVQLPGQGYTFAEVPSGPNQGFWWITSIRYEMRRVGNANPAVLSTSARTHPLSSQIAKQCKTALKLQQVPAALNFYDYNRCRGIVMASFVDAVFGHEESGYNGGTGHEGLAVQAAKQPWNDPYANVESVVTRTQLDLETEADRRATVAADAITNFAADPNPKGNWPSGTIWFWDSSLNSYTSYTLSGF